MMSRRCRGFLVVAIIFLASTGCTLMANLPMPFALLRSPITLDTKMLRGNINAPLTSEESCLIRAIAEDISHGMARQDAINGHRVKDQECIRDGASQEQYEILNRIDDLKDLQGQDVLVFVGISGGGSRAAALAAHSMSLIEKAYSKLQEKLQIRQRVPLVSLIDAFSTVSGGSLYAYQVGRSKAFLDLSKDAASLSASHEASDLSHAICGEMYEPPVSHADFSRKLSVWENCFFFNLSRLSNARNVGVLGGVWYLSPGNFFLGPMATFLTDLNYLDVLAGGVTLLGRSVPSALAGHLQREVKHKKLELSPLQADRLETLNGGGAPWETVNPFRLKIGDLSPKPRLYFNTTALENGMPFVITQSITHLSSDVGSLRTARLDTVIPHHKPLSHAYTLEEINSAPSGFSLAHAAMASAAFPLGLEPLEVAKYGYREGYETVYRTRDRLHLTDGGVFDNSGLTTLSDLILYLNKTSTSASKKTVVLVSINAESDDYDLAYPVRETDRDSWYSNSPISMNFPLRTGALGVKAFEAIHFTNKRRAEEIAVREVMHLVEMNKKGAGVQLFYFPISLNQLSSSDSNKLDDPDGLFGRVREVPTSFGISASDELAIEQAANKILSSSQKSGWKVGPRCNGENGDQVVNRLGEALAFALIRKGAGRWDASMWDESEDGTIVSEWCKARAQVKSTPSS